MEIVELQRIKQVLLDFERELAAKTYERKYVSPTLLSNLKYSLGKIEEELAEKDGA